MVRAGGRRGFDASGWAVDFSYTASQVGRRCSAKYLILFKKNIGMVVAIWEEQRPTAESTLFKKATMFKKTLRSLLALFAFCVSLSASAIPIAYVYEGFGTGTIGASAFSTDFSIIGYGNTDNIAP